ncbi:MAG TPA: tetratricopeptide repeat protein, partial [Rhodobacteraceae bacterium]|nr:tetratricopeptide repeat protein [Paracoccaceae bacterium]
MNLRRLSVYLSTVAVVIAGCAFYISPDPTVSTCINWNKAAETLSACTTLIESPDLGAEELPVLLSKRAWAARRLGDFDTAMSDIDRALALQPDAPLLWVNRAFINDAQDKWTAADKDFERALALAPENLFTIMDRAVILTGRGDYTGALRDYEQALEINPNSKRAMMGIIRSLDDLEQHDDVLEWLAKAAVLWPDDAWFPTEMGVTHYVISKDYLSALAAFEAVERIDPDNVANRVLLGATHLKLGNLDIGKTYIEQHAAQLAQSMETEG